MPRKCHFNSHIQLGLMTPQLLSQISTKDSIESKSKWTSYANDSTVSLNSRKCVIYFSEGIFFTDHRLGKEKMRSTRSSCSEPICLVLLPFFSLHFTEFRLGQLERPEYGLFSFFFSKSCLQDLRAYWFRPWSEWVESSQVNHFN